jgi:hypothetical protein
MTTPQTVTSESWQKGSESISSGSAKIQRTLVAALEGGGGCIIGRQGTIELQTLLSYVHTGSCKFCNLDTLEKHAGIFPNTYECIIAWLKEYMDAVKSSDVLAVGWYPPLATMELNMLEIWKFAGKRVPLRALEPYYTPPQNSWLRALDGRYVAVVSSFAGSIKKQLPHLQRIWKGREEILPVGVQWSCVQSYYSPVLAQGNCEWSDDIASWSDAVTSLEMQVVESGAKVALLGCGGLAMPLALRLKKRGIAAIVLGGAIQILFGIKGRRWNTHPIISTFYNDYWVYPSAEETPGAAKDIEGGCYW